MQQSQQPLPSVSHSVQQYNINNAAQFAPSGGGGRGGNGGRGGGGRQQGGKHAEHAPSPNLFINYIPAHVDESALSDVIINNSGGSAPLSVFVMRHLDTKQSKGYAFALFSSVQIAMHVKQALDGYNWGNKRLQIKYADAPSSSGAPSQAQKGGAMPQQQQQQQQQQPIQVVMGPQGTYLIQQPQPFAQQPQTFLQQGMVTSQQGGGAGGRGGGGPGNETNLYIKGIPPSWSRGQLHQFFSQYGSLIDCVIMMEQGRSTGMGFVEFSDSLTAQRVMLECSGKIIDPSSYSVPLHIRLAKQKKKKESTIQQGADNTTGVIQQQPQNQRQYTQQPSAPLNSFTPPPQQHQPAQHHAPQSQDPLSAGGHYDDDNAELNGSQSSTSTSMTHDPYGGKVLSGQVQDPNRRYYSQRERTKQKKEVAQTSFGPLLVHDPYSMSRFKMPKPQAEGGTSSPISPTHHQPINDAVPQEQIMSTGSQQVAVPAKPASAISSAPKHSCTYCKHGTSLILENMPFESSQCDLAVRKLLAPSGTIVFTECLANGQAIATFAEHMDAVQCVQYLANSPHGVALLDCTQLEPAALMGDFI